MKDNQQVLGRPLKRQLRRHRGRVLLQQVRIGSHQQRTTVFVTEPSGYGRNVDTFRNRLGGKPMSQIVVSDMGQAQSRAGAGKSVRAFVDSEHEIRTSSRSSKPGGGLQICQQSSEPCIHWQESSFRIFGTSNTAIDPNAVIFDMGPFDVSCLVDSTTGEGQEFNQVSALNRTPCTLLANGVDDLI